MSGPTGWPDAKPTNNIFVIITLCCGLELRIIYLGFPIKNYYCHCMEKGLCVFCALKVVVCKDISYMMDVSILE